MRDQRHLGADPAPGLPPAPPERQQARLALERRRLLFLIASASGVAPERAATNAGRVVQLCEESQAIVRWLIDNGYHRTAEEAVHAALEALRRSPL